jgi:NAD(P)-dependent dehydrogenase (short-subunit alcohol dehydrogenase family)
VARVTDSRKRFVGKVVLLTGASRGLGRAMAHAFAAEGAAVALVSTREEGAKAVAAEIAGAGGRALPLAGDVSREDDVRHMVARTEQTLGPIDILVNNAGISGPTASVVHLSLADWQQVIAVNLTGAFLCSREVLKGMVARAQGTAKAAGGSILNISSIAGKISYPQRSPYASSKWGLIGLTLTLAEEVGPYGIRVNCICPGPVVGEHLDDVIAKRAQTMGWPVEKVREKFLALTMLKRLVQPEEVATMALFLASEEAASITGQAIDVTGGLAQMPG